MERAVAIKKLRKLLGKKVGFQVNANAPTPQERDAARAALPAATEERNKIEKQKRERCNAILAADEEYQRLCVEYEAAKKQSGRLLSIMNQHRFTVGTNEGLFFLVKAQGDSWEEVIDKVSAKETV